MPQYLEFFQNHALLVLAFFATAAGLVWATVQSTRGAGHKLSPADATRLINTEDAVVLDLRSDADFNRGHIVGSVHVPHNQLDEQGQKLEKYKSRPVIAACRTGQQSAGAASALRKKGFEKVYLLGGGILAWEGASLPLTKKK